LPSAKWAEESQKWKSFQNPDRGQYLHPGSSWLEAEYAGEPLAASLGRLLALLAAVEPD
jgi:hypothetical protein